jgi:hypothetical protein
MENKNMILKFSQDEVAEIIKAHVKSKYRLAYNQPVDVKLSVKKRFLFGLTFDSASVSVPALKQEDSDY